MKPPLSSTANRKPPVWFFAIFALLGLGLFIPFFLLPVFKIVAAQNWNATPCVIASSAVERHSDGDGSTYSVNIVYTYQAGGRSWTGKRYQFLSGSSSGRAAKAAIVARYPPGARAVCYVNPADPSDAVMERGFTRDLWFGLIPLLFAGIGLAGMIYFLRARTRPPSQSQILWQPAGAALVTDYSAAPAGERELKPSMTHFGKLFLFAGMAAFWNGIVSVFIRELFTGWRTGHRDYGLAVFLVPFVAVGAGLILAAAYQVLTLFNPRVHIKVNPSAVALGEPMALAWSLQGRAGALASLRITLEGSEQATYPNGDHPGTATHVFFTTEIVNTSDRSQIPAGRTGVTLPRGTMHSLSTGHNKIVWQLRVRGEIRRWPDMTEDYPLAVLPARKGAA